MIHTIKESLRRYYVVPSWCVCRRVIRVIAYACIKQFNECDAVMISDGTSENVKVSRASNFLPIYRGYIIGRSDGTGITKKLWVVVDCVQT